MLRYGIDNRTQHKQIKTKQKQAKDEWLNEICSEIERMNNHR